MATPDGFQFPLHPDAMFFPLDNNAGDYIDSDAHSPLIFSKPKEELAVVHRTDQQSLFRGETHLEEPVFKRKGATSQCKVPNGLASEIFRPLWAAVYNQKKLQKRTVVCADLERLCIALLNAAKAEERPFLSVGCYVKGLCIILSQKMQVLTEDVNALLKKLLISKTIPALTGRPKHRKTYRETDDDDDDYELPKRKRHTKKATTTKKKLLAVEDYHDTRGNFSDGAAMNADGLNNGDMLDAYRDYMPMDQIEVLQLMNVGIGLGIGTELAFYSNGNASREKGISYHNFEHGMVERPCLSLELLQQNRETINPDTFLDIHSLSSPFKLNGYSFTPQTRLSFDTSEADTTIASTDLALQSDSVELNTPEFKTYDLDWDIYNDPFEEEDIFASNTNRAGEPRVTAEPRTRRMVLQYTEPDGKPVHLVKSKGVARYDAKITGKTTKTPKRVRLTKSQKTLDTFAASPQILCDKTQLFTNAIDSLVRSVIGQAPTEAGTTNPAGEKAPAAADATACKASKPDVELLTTKHGDKWFKRLERQTKAGRKAQTPRHTFDNETMSTVEVIESYRARVREQGTAQPTVLSEIIQGRSKENAALIFYRTLVLANADFIALSQAKEHGSPIEVTPAKRFWEPIQTSRDIKA